MPDSGTFRILLGAAADLSAVVTAVVAGIVAWKVLWQTRQRRVAVETYLQEVKTADQSDMSGHGLRSALHISGKLGISEAQVFEAAASSSKVRRTIGRDSLGRANLIWFSWKGEKRRVPVWKRLTERGRKVREDGEA